MDMIPPPNCRLVRWVALAALIGIVLGAGPPADDLPPLPDTAQPAPGTEIPWPTPFAIPDRAEAELRPTPLRRPIDLPPLPAWPPLLTPEFQQFFQTPWDPPIGYTGPTSVVPREGQQDPHFIPLEDRWRTGFPEWDRYGKGHPVNDDYPYMPGRINDPFNQNVLKGDYPIIGQHLFLDVNALAFTFQEYRQIPTATTPFESTARPNEANFFGRPNQYFSQSFFVLAVDLMHGDAAFKPADWKIRLAPTFNVNNLSVQELGIVSPNVLQGTSRTREFWALQEAFLETKIADVSPDYDFVSVRLGTQPFVSDFRGFLFADVNRAIRFFGTRNANRDQWNVAYFRQWEKDTNSFLNTFNDRRQNLVFANYFRQDFLVPGYTSQVSFSFNNDPRSYKFDNNRFLVRPDPVGVARPHEIDVAYFGWAGDGHFGRYNITHQFYEAFGRDSLNPLAGQAQTINAQMFAIEGSYDRDWARFKVSFFYSSGDHNINNSHATGFDTILDAPNFAGGPFSYWNRQAIPLFGVNLVQRLSLVPDLRSSKIQGQSNFVNPGLLLPNFGVDFDLTPKLKMINNCNFLFFDSTNVLEQFLFQGDIHKFIGTDLSTGFDYRPLLSENVNIILGLSVLIPGQGFKDLYDNFDSSVGALFAGFLFLNFAY
ncbi:MAG: hypothetical protein P4L84_19120 [Isosphaeraceae bacterium]|nr:hypothetical protein [Isosphaeraceae bacterium]